LFRSFPKYSSEESSHNRSVFIVKIALHFFSILLLDDILFYSLNELRASELSVRELLKNKKGVKNYKKGKCKRHFYILGNIGSDMNVVL